MRCPHCEAILDAEWTCLNGHHFPMRNGVRRFIDPTFAATLDPFLEQFSKFRDEEGIRIMDPAVYPDLPHSGLAFDKGAWQLRIQDLALVRGLLRQRKETRVLDVGAWNAWLSHHLTQDGHSVTAVDRFTDTYDGLGAVIHYPKPFRVIQCDLERLDLFEGPFDLIVIQRCTAFFPDLTRSIAQWLSLLAPGGTILLTGLSIYGNESVVRRSFRNKHKDYRERTGGAYMQKDVKGYLNEKDAAVLRMEGVALHRYPRPGWKIMADHIRIGKPKYLFGILQKYE